MREKMSRWGIGTIFAPLSILYGIVMILISYYYCPVFQIEIIPYNVVSVLGIVLIIIGIPFHIISAVTVMRAYNADSLVTSGIFQCCRHPLYASWVIFIVPGIALLVDSWIGLTTPIFMFIILRILVRKEETYLEEVFGSGYLEYKKNVPCIVPCGWMKRGV